MPGFGNVLKGVTGLQTRRNTCVRPQCEVIVGQTPIPFGKLQEGNHLLRGEDLSQRVVWVHQYNSSDDNPLKEKASFVRNKEIYSIFTVFIEIRLKKK